MNLIDWINGVTTLGRTTMAKFQENIQQAIADASVPIGACVEYYGTTLPSDKWKWADGSALSRTTYSILYQRYGTRYGSGDGNTTFNLPDHRERMGVGYKSGSTNGTSGATLGTLGAKGGEFKHKITQAELPAINLEVKYDNSLPIIDNKSANTGYESFERTVNFNANDTSSSSHLITDKLGSGTAMNNMQPYLVCNYMIKVK